MTVKSQLNSKLKSLQDRLERIEQDACQSHSPDFSEQAQERENDEVIDVIGNETRASIVAVERALSHLAAGNYGICEKCGHDIDRVRLQALPEATCCLDCG